MNILKNSKYAWKVLTSHNYIIATDKMAVCKIDIVDPWSIKTITLLSAQRSAIEDLKEKLEGIIDQHDEATKVLES